MSTYKLHNLPSNLSNVPYDSFKVLYPRTSTASRSGELTLSGTQLLLYFGITLATSGLLIWAGVHYMVFAP